MPSSRLTAQCTGGRLQRHAEGIVPGTEALGCVDSIPHHIQTAQVCSTTNKPHSRPTKHATAQQLTKRWDCKTRLFPHPPFNEAHQTRTCLSWPPPRPRRNSPVWPNECHGTPLCCAMRYMRTCNKGRPEERPNQPLNRRRLQPEYDRVSGHSFSVPFFFELGSALSSRLPPGARIKWQRLWKRPGALAAQKE